MSQSNGPAGRQPDAHVRAQSLAFLAAEGAVALTEHRAYLGTLIPLAGAVADADVARRELAEVMRRERENTMFWRIALDTVNATDGTPLQKLDAACTALRNLFGPVAGTAATA